MRLESDEMSSDEIKEWIFAQDFPPLRCDLPMRDQITLALQDMGFQRVRANQVVPHPVWNVSGHVGTFRAEGVRSVKIALKRICRELGFRVRISEIVATLYRDRLNASFALVPPNAAPVDVQDDGGWIPEHLEFEEAL